MWGSRKQSERDAVGPICDPSLGSALIAPALPAEPRPVQPQTQEQVLLFPPLFEEVIEGQGQEPGSAKPTA